VPLSDVLMDPDDCQVGPERILEAASDMLNESNIVAGDAPNQRGPACLRIASSKPLVGSTLYL
jgi:hypothetical protein